MSIKSSHQLQQCFHAAIILSCRTSQSQIRMVMAIPVDLPQSLPSVNNVHHYVIPVYIRPVSFPVGSSEIHYKSDWRSERQDCGDQVNSFDQTSVWLCLDQIKSTHISNVASVHGCICIQTFSCGLQSTRHNCWAGTDAWISFKGLAAGRFRADGLLTRPCLFRTVARTDGCQRKESIHTRPDVVFCLTRPSMNHFRWHSSLVPMTTDDQQETFLSPCPKINFTGTRAYTQESGFCKNAEVFHVRWRCLHLFCVMVLLWLLAAAGLLQLRIRFDKRRASFAVNNSVYRNPYTIRALSGEIAWGRMWPIIVASTAQCPTLTAAYNGSKERMMRPG